MMRKTEEFAYMADTRLGLQAAELPYDAMSMLVILPEPGQFRNVEAKLDADLVGRIVKGLHSRRLALGLPRFTMEAEYELVEPLSRLGVQAAFDGEKADFSAITDDAEGLAVDRVFHKARVRVDEHGTEAAAATAMAMLGIALETEEPIPFVVDRPFIFCIRDPETGALLFLGRVTDPGAGMSR